MSRGKLRLPALAAALAAALLLCGALCLLGGLRLPEGVTAAKTPYGRIYTHGSAPTTLSLKEDDGEGHLHAVTTGGQAALLLTSPGDGHRTLARELARRGVAVLCAGEKTDPAAAWDYLLNRDFVNVGAVALIASPGREEEARTLAEALVGGGRECAALILSAGLPDASALRTRNILCLGDTDTPTEGYFAEGTARRTVAVEKPGWQRRESLLPVIDWLGTSLGHAVELPDGDLITLKTNLCLPPGTALLFCGAAAAGSAAWSYLSRKGKKP